jgi:hypothetical protein
MVPRKSGPGKHFDGWVVEKGDGKRAGSKTSSPSAKRLADASRCGGSPFSRKTGFTPWG